MKKKDAMRKAKVVIPIIADLVVYALIIATLLSVVAFTIGCGMAGRCFA